MASKPLLVVAIDFGTTYSGYAFSFLSDYQKDPRNVCSQNFHSGMTLYPKVPTSVLFNHDKKFDCFGQDAENKYAEMSEKRKAEAKRWFYFERFKMKLHKNKTLSRDTELPDYTKKKGMPALDVFSAAIKFMKDHLMQTLEEMKISFEESRERVVPIKDSDIKWVLTVPAIWDDNAKNFMREAAEKAGIPTDRLELVLEPEAASVYCLEYNKAHQTLSKDVSLLQPGTKFMMVDCGGGTIDISVFELKANDALRHLHHPEGSSAGGTKVDDAFSKFVYALVGFDGATSFDRMEMLALRQNFETAKCMKQTSEKAAIDVPMSVLLALNEGINQRKEYAGRVSMVRNKLMIELAIYKSFFKESATSITKYIRTVLDDKKVGHVDAILLAGGFSESDIIQDAVRDAFSRDRVLVVPSPSAAVMIGAVMLGHNPNTIATRVSPYTYGVACARPFLEGIHDPEKKFTNDHGVRCKDIFDIYIKKNDEVDINTLLKYRSYTAGFANQTETVLPIYRSTKRSPIYVDEEDSEKIGSVTIPMPDTRGGKHRTVKAAMMVGGTELKVIAKDETTQVEVIIMCDFLSKTN